MPKDLRGKVKSFCFQFIFPSDHRRQANLQKLSENVKSNFYSLLKTDFPALSTLISYLFNNKDKLSKHYSQLWRAYRDLLESLTQSEHILQISPPPIIALGENKAMTWSLAREWNKDRDTVAKYSPVIANIIDNHYKINRPAHHSVYQLLSDIIQKATKIEETMMSNRAKFPQGAPPSEELAKEINGIKSGSFYHNKRLRLKPDYCNLDALTLGVNYNFALCVFALTHAFCAFVSFFFGLCVCLFLFYFIFYFANFFFVGFFFVVASLWFCRHASVAYIVPFCIFIVVSKRFKQ